MSGKRIPAGERRPGSAYGTRMEGRECLCGAVQAIGRGTVGRGVVVGSVGANPRFWHHCFEHPFRVALESAMNAHTVGPFRGIPGIDQACHM